MHKKFFKNISTVVLFSTVTLVGLGFGNVSHALRLVNDTQEPVTFTVTIGASHTQLFHTTLSVPAGKHYDFTPEQRTIGRHTLANIGQSFDENHGDVFIRVGSVQQNYRMTQAEILDEKVRVYWDGTELKRINAEAKA